MTRVFLIAFLASLLYSNCSPAPKAQQEEQEPEKIVAMDHLFIGTYTQEESHVKGKAEGIYKLDRAIGTGHIAMDTATTDLINPSFLTISTDQRFLYAVNETGPEGIVSAFAIDPTTQQLSLLNSQSSHSAAACHVATDREGRSVFVANYVGGIIAMYPIREDGSLGKATDIIELRGSGPNKARQDSSHPHSVNLGPREQFAYVPDLGSDKIWIFKVDYENGKLIPANPAFTKLPGGSGPRHMAFHPDAPFTYVINELNNTITGFEVNLETGELKEVITAGTLPQDFEGDNATADIHISPNGSYLYGSNRGHNSIAIYKIEPATGHLTFVAHRETGGEVPRNFMITKDGLFLYVANQNSDNIVGFKIDRSSGRLDKTDIDLTVPTPVCIKQFVK